MLRLQDITTTLATHRVALFRKYHLTELGVFGSIARGDHNADSDIDIVIDYEGSMGLEFVDLADELESLLHHKVDLVSKKAIRPKLLERIKTELVYV